MSPDQKERSLDIHRPDGTALRLYLTGRGETLLLVHGWTLDRHSFDLQRSLAQTRQLATYDRRGCGESTAAPDLAGDVADIDCIIDGLGGDAVHLLGVSQGARLALRYAASRPERLRSLILQGVIVDGFNASVEDEGAIPLDHYRSLCTAGDLDALRRAWLAHPLMASDDLDDRQQSALEAMVGRYRGTDLLQPPAAPATDPLPALAGTPLPTLIISGERETPARREHARELLRRLATAREVVIPDSGHLCNLSQPAAYNRAVSSFLGSLSRPRESS